MTKREEIDALRHEIAQLHRAQAALIAAQSTRSIIHNYYSTPQPWVETPWAAETNICVGDAGHDAQPGRVYSSLRRGILPPHLKFR